MRLECHYGRNAIFRFWLLSQITWGSTRRRRRWGTRRMAAPATGCPPTASRRWATSARTRRRTWSCNQIYYHPRVPISLIISIPCKIPDRSSYYQIDAYTRDSEPHFWWRRRDSPLPLVAALVARRSYIYRGVGGRTIPRTTRVKVTETNEVKTENRALLTKRILRGVFYHDGDVSHGRPSSRLN